MDFIVLDATIMKLFKFVLVDYWSVKNVECKFRLRLAQSCINLNYLYLPGSEHIQTLFERVTEVMAYGLSAVFTY